MLLQSTTKPPILGVLTKHHISEAFRIDFANKSMLLRSTTKSLFVSIRGRFDQTSFFMRGVIVPPSKLIVKTKSPQRFFLFIRGGLLLRGGDYTSTSRCFIFELFVRRTMSTLHDAAKFLYGSWAGKGLQVLLGSYSYLFCNICLSFQVLLGS